MVGLVLAFAFVSSSQAPAKLTADGLVQKTILKPGREGPKPQQGDSVQIHYIGRFLDGKVFDSSRDRGQIHSFVVGRGVIAGWSIAVETMNVGELAEVTIDYEYGYGERGYPPVIPAKTKLIFEIELVSVGNS
jgi:FKBP-type peptidyl-prolyl cis-trans isomerase